MKLSNETIIEEVRKDPKMMLLSQAIIELSEHQMVMGSALKTVQNIIVDQQKGLIALNEALSKLNDSLNLIISQMNVSSFQKTLKGIYIK